MRQSQKALYSTVVAMSLSAAFAISQPLPRTTSTSPADEEQANDMGRGLSRESQQLNEDIEAISPVRRIERNPNPVTSDIPGSSAYRSFDGNGNNQSFGGMNSRGTPLHRLLPADYDDGISAVAASAVANPRAISNAVATQTESIPACSFSGRRGDVAGSCIIPPHEGAELVCAPEGGRPKDRDEEADRE